jgi:hypothetical protein
LILILNFFAFSGLEQKADLTVIDSHDFFDDFIRKVTYDDLLIIFPFHDISFVEVDAN